MKSSNSGNYPWMPVFLVGLLILGVISLCVGAVIMQKEFPQDTIKTTKNKLTPPIQFKIIRDAEANPPQPAYFTLSDKSSFYGIPSEEIDGTQVKPLGTAEKGTTSSVKANNNGAGFSSFREDSGAKLTQGI